MSATTSTGRTGLTAQAMSVTLCVAVKAGIREFRTRTVAEKVPDALGVQEKAPVVALIVAPAGAPASRLNVSGLAGTFGSVAATVKVSVCPRATVLVPSAPSTGDRLGVTVREFVPWLVVKSGPGLYTAWMV